MTTELAAILTEGELDAVRRAVGTALSKAQSHVESRDYPFDRTAKRDQLLSAAKKIGAQTAFIEARMSRPAPSIQDRPY